MRFSRAAGGCCLGVALLLSNPILCSAQTSSTIPVVTIQATVPIAFINETNSGPPTVLGKLGMFTVFRKGNTNLTLNVYYQISGTASNGVDYAQISNWVTIPAGATSNSIPILPLTNVLSASVAKTVILQLAPSPTLNPVNFEIGVPSNAVVYIERTNLPPFPQVTIFNPTNGAVFYTPTNIQMNALTGYGFDATNVEFFAGTNDLGRGVPYLSAGIFGTYYSLTWTNPLPGNYPLTAVATDDGGASTTSAAVNITVLPSPPTHGYITAVLRSACTDSPTPPPPVGGTRVGPDYVIETVADADPMNWTNAQRLVTDAIFESLMPLYCALPKTGCVTDSVQWNIITYDTNGNPRISGCAASGCQLHSCAPTNLPPVVNIIQPHDGDEFYTPTNIQIVAQATDPDGSVTNVEFFAGTNDLGSGSAVVLDPPGINGVTGLVYFFNWLNPSPGTYPLTAIATDNDGISTTSLVVNVTVHPSLLPPVSIVEPKDGDTFYTPTNIFIGAIAGAKSVQFFAGTNSLGFGWPMAIPAIVCSNCPPSPNFGLIWTNPPVGNFALSAVATDYSGVSATSAPVNIIVLRGPQTNQPPVVRMVSPANGATFFAPVNIPLYAYASDPNGFVESVQFFDGTNSLGFGQPVPSPITGTLPPIYPTNVYYLVWTNAPVGVHVLTAQATIVFTGHPLVLVAVSDPVKIAILQSVPPPTNRPPIVSIVASDPVAIEGTNCFVWRGETNSTPTWAAWPTAVCRFFTNCGPKTATFTVRRHGDTNDDLTVPYDIGGTASNGVDYVALPGVVTIPSGERRAFITIVPIDDGPPDVNKTVALTLTPSTNAPPDYVIGFPRRAAAVILEHIGPRPLTGLLPDKSFHFVASGPDAAWFCVESSTNLIDWTPICTNQVVNGSIDFIDTDAPGNPSKFYRAVPLTNAPSD
ncbi:MAG: Ig-like domain-containing protein [Limisphaerales bacterium]